MSDQISKRTEKYLSQFRDYLESMGMVENTVESYAQDVKHFLKFLEDEKVDTRDADAGPFSF